MIGKVGGNGGVAGRRDDVPRTPNLIAGRIPEPKFHVHRIGTGGLAPVNAGGQTQTVDDAVGISPLPPFVIRIRGRSAHSRRKFIIIGELGGSGRVNRIVIGIAARSSRRTAYAFPVESAAARAISALG